MVRKKQTAKTTGRKVKTTAKKTFSSKKAKKTESAFDLTLNTIAEYIRTRAYYIWEDLGKPQDKDTDIWGKAEKEILTQLIKK